MPWDITPSEIRQPLHDAGDYEDFVTKKLPGTNGINVVYAKPKAEKDAGLVAQSLRFDRSKWSVSQAKKWFAAHEDDLKDDLMDSESMEIAEEQTFIPPKGAQEAAKKVLKWREEYPSEIKGMTRVGWVRANQLAKGEPLSRETIGRIAAFARHKENSEVDPKFTSEPWKDAGYVAWLGWGGDSAINWASRIIERESNDPDVNTDSCSIVNFNGLILRSMASDVCQDAVETEFILSQADIVNGNNRAYTTESLKESTEAFNNYIQLLGAHVYKEHSQPLFNEEGELRGYDDRQNPCLADYLWSTYDEETKQNICRIRWNNTDLGKVYAKRAIALQNGEDVEPIYFSVRAKKRNCRTENGYNICDLVEIFGGDVVEEPALQTATIIKSEIVSDSINTSINQPNLTQPTNPHAPACNCGSQEKCACEQALDSHGMVSELVSPTTIGDPPMLQANEIKKLSLITPPLGDDQVKQWILSAGWCDAAEIDQAMAYWQSLKTESTPVTQSLEVSAKEEPAKTEPMQTEEMPKEKAMDMEIKKEEPKATDMEAMSIVPEAFLKASAMGKIAPNDLEMQLKAMEIFSEEAIAAALTSYQTMMSETPKVETEIEMESADKKGLDMKSQKSCDNATDNKQTTKSEVKEMSNPDASQIALDNEIREAYRQQKADNEFRESVRACFKDQELTDSQQKDLMDLAFKHRTNLDAALAVVSNELKHIKTTDDTKKAMYQQATDNLRKEMGYWEGQSVGRSNIEVTATPVPGLDHIDKIQQAADSLLKNGQGYACAIPIHEEVERRQLRREALRKSKAFQQIQGSFLGSSSSYIGKNNYQALQEATDAISSTTDIHGPSYVYNADTVLAYAILEETFAVNASVENCVKLLGPGEKKPVWNNGAYGPAGEFGGCFVIPLETIRQDESGVARNYRVDPGQPIPVNSTDLKRDTFFTRSRMISNIIDVQTATQLVQGPIKYDVFARAAMNIGSELGRGIDTEVSEDLVLSALEKSAVQFSGTETPATSHEWFYNSGGLTALGYGATVKGAASLLGPYATTTLKTSVDNGANYPAPLIKPRPYYYYNQGVLTTTTLFPCTFTLPSSTTPVEGDFDPITKQIVSRPGTTATHAFDWMLGRVLFTSASNVDGTNKAVFSEYWYASRYIYYSKLDGTVYNPLSGGELPAQRATNYLAEVARIAGLLAQTEQKYPDFNLSRYDFMNSYVSRADRFDKQISPTDAILPGGFGKGIVAGIDAGVTFVKSSNPRFPAAGVSISNMGQSFASVVGQSTYSFYGLSDIYPNMGPHRAMISGGTNVINQAINAIMQEWGFLDVVGTPNFSDYRNFANYVILVVD